MSVKPAYLIAGAAAGLGLGLYFLARPKASAPLTTDPPGTGWRKLLTAPKDTISLPDAKAIASYEVGDGSAPVAKWWYTFVQRDQFNQMLHDRKQPWSIFDAQKAWTGSTNKQLTKDFLDANQGIVKLFPEWEVKVYAIDGDKPEHIFTEYPDVGHREVIDNDDKRVYYDAPPGEAFRLPLEYPKGFGNPHEMYTFFREDEGDRTDANLYYKYRGRLAMRTPATPTGEFNIPWYGVTRYYSLNDKLLTGVEAAKPENKGAKIIPVMWNYNTNVEADSADHWNIPKSWGKNPQNYVGGHIEPV